ncbi:hypothetical protein QAD02_024145 [Eretmocerus hayati]|uniref:Uncharacterized protein n=1 Tax=Eretmocerus hayati TaxID=131215 RepID=A0ACC2Q2Q5_9HYME|nr:hypothetical protein QAD02_024145 [Eretmocerus hayati]
MTCSTQSVEVQTEQSSLASMCHQSVGISKKSETQVIGDSTVCRNKTYNSDRAFHEFETIKLKKTGICCVTNSELERDSETIAAPAILNSMNLDYDESTNCSLTPDRPNQKEIGPPTVKGTLVVGKAEALRSKESSSKELIRSKKEPLSNPSRSFKEIFNFFKDRDRRRNLSDQKTPPIESQKLRKLTAVEVHGLDKPSQLKQSPLEHNDREAKLKNDTQGAQHTPLMFSRCSSLGSLNSFEQASIHDDHSSVVSDFSRTSGAASPSDLPSSPTQMTPGCTKTQAGCFGEKEVPTSQDRSKMTPDLRANSHHEFNAVCTEENFVKASNGSVVDPGETECSKEKLLKESIFEDHVTSFKDESTPSRLHSIAASSLSSLTIDDDDDLELISKKGQIECGEITQSTRKDPIGESKFEAPQAKLIPEFDSGFRSCLEEDGKEEKDELADLTPHEEQLLDQYIRKGIAKWTKRNENEIKPFSWDVGLTCRATLTLLTNKIVLNFARKNSLERGIGSQNLTAHNVTSKDTNHRNFMNKNSDKICQASSSLKTETVGTQKTFGSSNKDPGSINYEEQLLDQCIRKGMAKFTRKSVGDIRPFGWDVNQICLTTKSMMLYDQDDQVI